MFTAISAILVAFATEKVIARCPTTRTVSCVGQPPQFRTIDGSCNNPEDPTLGMANTPLIRMMPSKYADDRHAPRRSVSGAPLPSSRRLVTALMPDRDFPSTSTNMLVMTWAQLVTHDMSRIQAPFPLPGGQCCGFANATDACDRIDVPADDPFYSDLGVRCIGVARSASSPCNGADHQQNSLVTHYLDASFVYVSNFATEQRLRSKRGGRLRSQVIQADEFLPRGTSSMDAGDGRVVITPMLATLQTLFMREHNRVARVLAAMNFHWNDERLFQEARRIVVAEWQLITYRDWLQWLIGSDTVQRQSLLPSTRSHSSDYNSSVIPSVANDFASAAYRAFHSMVANDIWFGGGGGERLERRLLNDVGPNVILNPANFKRVILGMLFQPSQTQDRFAPNEITGKLFKGRNAFGGDLLAVDIQRGREHGLPSYNDYRQLCNLPRAIVFDHFNDTISAENIGALRQLYEHPDDVDYIVGGLLEQIESSDPLATVTSPVFRCVVIDQFKRSKSGDRFFFDLGGSSGFNNAQLAAIGKQTMSRLICDNVSKITRVPHDLFLRIGVLRNGEVPCSAIRKMDLSENPGGGNRAGQSADRIKHSLDQVLFSSY